VNLNREGFASAKERLYVLSLSQTAVSSPNAPLAPGPRPATPRRRTRPRVYRAAPPFGFRDIREPGGKRGGDRGSSPNPACSEDGAGVGSNWESMSRLGAPFERSAQGMPPGSRHAPGVSSISARTRPRSPRRSWSPRRTDPPRPPLPRSACRTPARRAASRWRRTFRTLPTPRSSRCAA
jgi:hypothetical protein